MMEDQIPKTKLNTRDIYRLKTTLQSFERSLMDKFQYYKDAPKIYNRLCGNGEIMTELSYGQIECMQRLLASIGKDFKTILKNALEEDFINKNCVVEPPAYTTWEGSITVKQKLDKMRNK